MTSNTSSKNPFLRVCRVLHPGCLVVFCLATISGYSQADTAAIGRLLKIPLHYTVFKTATPPTIDGNLGDPAWKAAAWTEEFSDIEGDIRPRPTYSTRVKMLWDDQNLYVGAELDEPDIWAYLSKQDEIVFNDNDFEIFLDPNNNARRYFEVEINAAQTIFDLFLPKPYRNDRGAVVTWNFPGLRKAVHIDGTLNNGKDKDRCWTVEYAIPIRSMSVFPDSMAVAVHPGSLWRINFSRVEWDTEWKDGKYVRYTDSLTHQLLPAHNWVWSPQGIINMHFPERWGYLFFEDLPTPTATQTGMATPTAGAASDYGSGAAEPFGAYFLPTSEILKIKLWEVYYRQHLYYRLNGVYASTTAQLNMDAKTSSDRSGTTATTLVIEATPHTYIAILSSKAAGQSWSIDADGNMENWTLVKGGRDDWGVNRTP